MYKNYFISFAITILFSLQAEPVDQYRRYVESAQFTQKENGHIQVSILLTDGTLWNDTFDMEDATYFFKLNHCFTPGKEIYLDILDDHINYLMCGCINEQECYNFQVLIDTQTLEKKDSLPTLMKIEKVPFSTGLFSANEYFYYLYLSDNSIWQSTTPCNWKKGTHVYISLCPTENTTQWNLINFMGLNYYTHGFLDQRIMKNVTLVQLPDGN